MLRVKARTWLQMRNKMTQIKQEKIIEKQKHSMQEMGRMSKRFVSLSTLCSHIRSNHKIILAKAFQSLASKP